MVPPCCTSPRRAASTARSGDNQRAVASGLQRTGGLITSAALLLAVVLAALSTSQIIWWAPRPLQALWQRLGLSESETADAAGAPGEQQGIATTTEAITISAATRPSRTPR